MKALIGCAAIFFALATVQSVEAKGCLKGAAGDLVHKQLTALQFGGL